MIAVLLIVVSCKKKEDTPTPTPTPTPVPPWPEQKDVFTDPKHKIMSTYEVSNNRSFQGYGMYGAMKAGIGPMDIFKAGFGIFSAIEKYRQDQEYQAEINKINSSLSNIQTQLGVLENDFAALAAQLQYDMTQLMNEVYVLNSITATAPIITAYSNADENGFRWYSDQAKAHNSGSSADSIYMATQIQPRMNTFIENYTTGVNATTLQNAIETLNGYVIPSSTSAGLLSILSRNIVNQNKQSDPMDQYMILENYFLQIANYQFQALAVQLNCFVNDSIDYQSFSTWFAQMFAPQIEQYLKAVNFLAVSLYDYRNGNQFNADLPYVFAGMSPDTIVGKMLTRSQFLANLMYDACGVEVPVMCGSVVVPYYYNAGSGPTPVGNFTVSVGGITVNQRTDTLIKSPYPYTYWLSSTMYCYPDNQWKVLNYGKFGTADANWPTTQQTMAITGTSWGNINPIQGKITPLWYNPRNPAETSTVETDSCSFQFAYFAASWHWGYMAPCYATSAQRQQNYLGTSDNVGSTSDECNCPEEQSNTPFVSQFHSSQCKWETGGSGSLYYGNDFLFQHYFSGSFSSYSGGQVYACEFLYLNVLPATDIGGKGLSLWINYDYNHTCATELHHYFFKIGDGINEDLTCYNQLNATKTPYNCNGSVLNTKTNQSGNATVFLGGLKAETYSRPGFEMEMGVWETNSSYSFNASTILKAQYTFNGLYTDY